MAGCMKKKGSNLTHIANAKVLMRLKSHPSHKAHKLTYHLFECWTTKVTQLTFTNVQYHTYVGTMQHQHERTAQDYLSFSLPPLDWHQQVCRVEHHPSLAKMWASPLSAI